MTKIKNGLQRTKDEFYIVAPEPLTVINGMDCVARNNSTSN